MYDLFLERDGQEFLLRPLLNFGRGSYDGLHDMMTDPVTVQGLGDGGAHSSIVCDASMTTYMLTHWVRDRTRGPRLPLEYAVQRLTKDPADLYGLGDRGVLAPGRRADVNLVDFDSSHSATRSGSPTCPAVPVVSSNGPTATWPRSSPASRWWSRAS